jgi:methylmalonyl-CoA carboxyltransferase large subunit
MATATQNDLSATVEQLQAQIAELTRRLAAMPAPEAVTEEEVLAISAAVAAYLGVRAHIRQIRLVGSNVWAQQGRVSIQASHSLQG